ncbi:hydroxymethylglutaryl-CoA lyase [Streptosporangium subroseum]|uniref:Hydroxymethylglutaryl-CoA lyase n=1 Tax=Streptosporangium subroseum TaxID=106412 RepID=A0A239AH87_9ACTN|nr:hydroxymethylglutaryl-CoA lyase [Streptosporangium subroseum]SNR94732.1 hydroxymethylglutaryl-CoA lyase [Streptosporangium subroseum]
MNIEVVEVGPRDGLQNESVIVPTAAKVAYVEALIGAGLRRIEAVSFVHPVRVPQMADAEEVMARVPRVPGVRYAGLVLNERGLDRALKAGVDEVNVVVVATETFSQRNQGMSVDDAVRGFGVIAGRAREAGLGVTLTVGASFGCPFEGEVDPARVAELVRRCPEAQEVALADTIGVGVPSDVRRLVEAVGEVSALPLRFHFHNTRNTGYANALAALEAGAAALDASAGGIGGCPFAPAATGNIATEDLLYLLHRSGVTTGADLPGVLAAAALIEAELGERLPAQLGRAGIWPVTGP